ncbi:hypothetical protein B0H21DRAFT_821576 [Amylocystis lapponica]|nr:hypothetical protein B0H21DRAFT_821576 [Amylocystis lapponica]
MDALKSGPVTVGIQYAPLHSILKLEAISTNAALHTTMHPAFEGMFFVMNQSSTPVLVNSSAEDPAHFGRERVMDAHGDLSWFMERVRRLHMLVL